MLYKKNFRIPLDKFIENALYHPTNGYYMKSFPFGKQGDFITSPYISKIFSEMISIWLISYWRKFYKNKKINIIELGAGDGNMMIEIINSSRRFDDFYNNAEFIIYEKSKKLIKLQKKKLKKKVKWISNLSKITKRPTIFLGNEFLDALPIKQYLRKTNKWYERYVQKKNNSYSFVNKLSDIKKLEKKINFKISKKQKFIEISIEGIKIIKKLNKIISNGGGCMLFIDYAYEANKMHDTLQSVKKHKKVNIFKYVGKSDITHLINIINLKKIVKKLNLDINYTSQRNFLLNLGILQRAEILSANKNFLEKANIYYRINRLIDKNNMGEIFKVIHIHTKNKKFNIGFK